LDGENKNALAGAAAGFIIGLFFGNPLAGLKYGLAVGSVFDRPETESPTYDFTLSQNTRSERMPVPVIYGEHEFIGNTIYEVQPGPVSISRTLIDSGDHQTYSLSETNILTTPAPVIGETWSELVGFRTVFHKETVNPADYTFYYNTSQVVFDSVQDENHIFVCKFTYKPAVTTNLKTVVGLCEGEIDSVQDIQINDIPITSIPNCTYNVYLGTGTQAADPVNVNNETFRHTANIAIAVKASGVLNGSPKISCIIRGRKVQVWDADGDVWVTEWSQNPAYCLLDWLTNSRYGCGINLSKIDTSTFIDVAEYCDFLIDGKPRYSLNIAIDSSMEAPRSIELLLKTFGGILIYSDGLIKLKVEKSETPVFTFDMGNIVKGSFSYSPALKRREVPNRLWIEFIDPDNPSRPWEPAKLLIEDELDQEIREEVVEQSEQFWGVTDPAQAGRLGWLIFDYARYCKQFCSFKVGINAIHCEVGDVVYVTHTVPGWVNKKFRILSIELGEDSEAVLTLRAYNSNVYHDRAVQYISANQTALPNPFSVPDVEDLTVTELSERNNGDGTWLNRVKVTFTKPDYIHYAQAMIQIKVDAGDYVTDGYTDGEEYISKPLKAGDSCFVRVMALTSLSVPSPGVTSPEIIITGNTIPPAAPAIVLTVSRLGLVIDA
jgi:hypothetical protein